MHCHRALSFHEMEWNFYISATYDLYTNLRQIHERIWAGCLLPACQPYPIVSYVRRRLCTPPPRSYVLGSEYPPPGHTHPPERTWDHRYPSWTRLLPPWTDRHLWKHYLPSIDPKLQLLTKLGYTWICLLKITSTVTGPFMNIRRKILKLRYHFVAVTCECFLNFRKKGLYIWNSYQLPMLCWALAR